MKARALAAWGVLLTYAPRIFLVEVEVWREAGQQILLLLVRIFVYARDTPVRAAVRSILRDPEFSHPAERLHARSAVYREAHRVFRKMREPQPDLESHLRQMSEGNAAFAFWVLRILALVAGLGLLVIGFSVYGSLVEWLDRGSGVRENLTRISDNWFSQTAVEKVVVTAGVPCAVVLLVWLLRTLLQGIGSTSYAHREVVEEVLRPQVRLLLNNLSNVENPARLRVEIAPGLGDTNLAERLIDRPETARIRVLNLELGARSIAVSGPRGVGKTTLLKALSIDNERNFPSLRVLVAAPVIYETREFLLHLYIKVCEQILDVAGTPSRPTTRFVLTFLRRAIRSMTFCLAVTLILAAALPDLRTWLTGRQVPVPSTTISLLLLPTLAVVWSVAGRLRSGFVSRGTSAMVARCRAEIRLLKYLQTTTSEYSGGLKRSGFEATHKRTRQFATRPHSLPELVASYRSFVEDALVWLQTDRRPDARILICIDEVDRIAKAEDAERFLNDVKAIFGIRHCNYLVTVSEDALAGFERRVVRLRPALDSAFDEVIRLEPFSFGQSRQLVQQSVIGMPDAFVMLCHCISGGIPRDLVRAVRATLDQRRRFDASDIRNISEAVVAGEVAALRRGLLTRILGADTRVGSEVLSALAGTAGDPDLDLETVAAVMRAPVTQEETLRTTQELGAALYFYCTVQDVFAEKRELLLGRPDLADDLTAIRASLPVSASLAKAQLDAYRKNLNLRTVESVI